MYRNRGSGRPRKGKLNARMSRIIRPLLFESSGTIFLFMAANLFKENNYIQVPGFAIVRLKLSGNELLCFSLIYGFSQDEDSEFHGSLAYIASALNTTRQSALHILERLIDKGLIVKKELIIGGVKFCHYVHNYNSVVESATGCYQNSNTPPVVESATHNKDIDIDNIDNNINPTDGGLFPPDFQPITVTRPRGTSEGLCLFENSKFAEYNAFAEQFKEPEFKDIDIVYYYHVVADWSASKGAKKRDWIATARNIMRKDRDAGKLHLLTAGTSLTRDEIEYLKMMSN